MAYNPPQRFSAHLGTLYQELLQQALISPSEAPRGSFVSKRVKGHRYWYFQHRFGGQRKQHYLGRETEELLNRIETARALALENQQDLRVRRQLVSMLTAGGALVARGSSLRVLELLAAQGTFRQGGVLIGSHGFAVLGNMLGGRWDAADIRTQDLDIARDFRIAVGLSTDLELREAITHSAMPFFEIPQLRPDSPSTSFHLRGAELTVEFFTPMVGRTSSRPIPLPRFGVHAEPLRYLDYLLEDPQPAVVVGGAGVMVNVPGPARYALHKLIVSQRRPPFQQLKAAKDLRQAAQIIALLLEDRPGDLLLAWERLKTHGKEALIYAEKALRSLPAATRSDMLELLS